MWRSADNNVQHLFRILSCSILNLFHYVKDTEGATRNVWQIHAKLQQIFERAISKLPRIEFIYFIFLILIQRKKNDLLLLSWTHYHCPRRNGKGTIGWFRPFVSSAAAEKLSGQL